LEKHIPRAAPLLELLRHSPGVTAAEPRIAVAVAVGTGQEIGDVFARAVGANESYFRERLRATEKLVEGRWFQGPDELIIGAALRKDLGAKLGDELVLLGATQDGSPSAIKGRLVGVVRGDAELTQEILVPLEKIQWLTDIPEGATELLVYGKSLEDAPRLAGELRRLPALSGYAVQVWSEREPFTWMTKLFEASTTILILIVVMLVALGIWNTMMMSVLERTHEVGVLRALGMSWLGTIGLFVGEGLAIGVLGGILGVVAGIGPSLLIEKYGTPIGEENAAASGFAMPDTLYGHLSVEGMLFAFILGLAMACLGSLVPAIRAARIQPVTAMKSGR
jgi:putative ABC transport system permease protein